jgi:hypothetical protein
MADLADGTTEQVETPEPENESLSADASSFIPSEDSLLNPFFCLALCTCEAQVGTLTIRVPVLGPRPPVHGSQLRIVIR